MALPPGGIHDTSDGDKKRLMQRADSFAIGSGTREKKDLEDLEEFDEAFKSVIKEAATRSDREDQSKELAEHREEHAKLEGERRGSSSPSHQPFLGMSILPGINAPNLAVGETPEGHSKKRSAAVDGKEQEVVETVSPEILQGLKKAGLAQPIVSLDDPRIGGAAEGLKKDFVLSLRANERVYVWSRNSCHQILSVGLQESKLESAAGVTVETVTRRGRVDEKKVQTRPPSSEEFTLKDDV